MSPTLCDGLLRRARLAGAGAALLAGLVGLGCSAGAAPDGGSSAPDAGALVGTFSVMLNEAQGTNPAYTAIVGNVFDGPTPSQLELVVSTTDGACKLSKPVVPVCATACGGTAICVADGVCQNDPTLEDVGTVTMTGVMPSTGSGPLTLTSVHGSYSAAGDEEPAFPPFSEGDDVAVAATGGAYAAFSIHAKGVAPLVLPEGAVMVQKDQPLSFSWNAAGASATSTVHVKLEISHHGGLKGQIDCDTADTGALTISAALVTELVNLGYSGYPSVTVSRSAVGSTTIAPGRVELRLGEDVIRDVTIPGLTSCTDDSDCPTGQTCQTDLQCK